MNIKDIAGYSVVKKAQPATGAPLNISDIKGFTVVKKADGSAPAPATSVGPDGINHAPDSSYVGSVMSKAKTALSDTASGAKEQLESRSKEFEPPTSVGGILKDVALTGRQALATTGKVAEGVGGVLNSVVPDWLTTLVQKGSKGFQDIGDKIHDAHPELGKRLLEYVNKDSYWGQIIDKLSEGAKKHPDAIPVIQDAVNTILLGAGIESGGKAAPAGATSEIVSAGTEGLGTAMKAAGGAVEESGIASSAAKKSSFVEELVQPRDTVKVKEEQLPRNQTQGKGPFKKEVTKLSPSEQAAKTAVESVEGVSDKNTLRENYRAVQNANVSEAENLQYKLKQNDFVADKGAIKTGLDSVKAKISESPSLVGDAGKSATRMVDYAKKLIDKMDNLGSSVLQVRKDFDAWVESQKSGIFEKDTPISQSARLVRSVLNDYLDKNAVGQGVKESLSRQSAFYDALDNIAPKAAREAESAIGRFIDKVKDTATMKSLIGADIFTRLPVTVQAALSGIGAGGYLIYKAGQLVLKPELRTYLGRLLRQAGEVLSPEDRSVIENVVYPNKKPLALPPASAEGRASTPIIAPEAEEPARAVKAQKVISPDPKTGQMRKTYRSGSGPTIYEK